MQARYTNRLWMGVFTVSFLAFSGRSYAQPCTTDADCPADTTAINYFCATDHCEYAGIPGGCSTDVDCNDNFTCTANDHCSLGAPGGPTCRFPKNDPAGNDVCVDDGFSCTNTVGCNPFNPNHQPLTGCVHSKDDTKCPDKGACTTTIGCKPESTDPPPDPTTGCIYSPIKGCCSKVGQPCTSAADCNDNCSCTLNDDCNFGAPGGPVCQTSRSDPFCQAGNGGADGKTCTDDECVPTDPGADPTTGCITKRMDPKCPDDGYTCTSHECVPDADDANAKTGCITKKNNPNNPVCNDYKFCTDDDCNPSANPISATGCVNKERDGCCDDDIDCQNHDVAADKGNDLCTRHFCSDKTHTCVREESPNCGACCLAQAPSTTAGIGVGPVCTVLPQKLCLGLGNSPEAYQGDGTTCDPNPCEEPRLSVSEKGSILYYSGLEVGFSPAATTAGPGFALSKDTFITLVNDLNREVCVEWHFINGDDPLAAIPGIERAHPGWNSYDCVTCYTPHENVFMSLARGDGSLGCQPLIGLDPGTPPGRPDPDGLPGDRIVRGYAIAFAVDIDGNPISWNHLSGHATVVDYRNRSAWEYNTYAFQCVADPVAGNPCGIDPTTLSLDGVEYVLAWDRLLFDFYAVGSTAFSRVSPATAVTLNTELTLYPVSVDLRPNSTNTSGPVLTRADIVIWNENEDDRTGTSRCIDCWDQTLLSNYDAPNNFLLELLNTNKGYARINGVRADSCDGPGTCCCRQQCSITKADCENSSDCPPFGAAPGIPQTCGLFNCFDPDCTQADFVRGNPDRDCSENAALLGLSDKILTFGGAAPRRTDAAMTLVGIGTQEAAIRRNVITPTAPLKDDKRTPREGSR